ncbi:MAG: hypothetical protein HY325_05290 [Chloroflexi bacterium]|nr:hypothetical protein [Chloroflexota bacterium]
MVDYWLPLLGIFVSIVLSMWGYRQTVGARRERIRAANSELEKVLIRRIVLESYLPTVDDLSRLIGGKAREHRIKRGDLLSEPQLLDTVFTKITESDFMSQDRRNEVLERLSPVYTKVEKATEEETRMMELPRADKLIYARNRLSFTIGLFASLSGAIIVAIVAMSLEAGAFPIMAIITAFTGSLALITMIFIIYRIRESGEEPSARSAMQSAMDFEQEVINTLKKLRIPVFIAERTSGFDFIITLGERRVLIEVKAHTRRPPLPYISSSIGRLNSAIRAKSADEGIIVTKESYEFPDDLLKNTKIRIMTLRELRNYMAHYSTK